jgi:REP element-mobilizing transposase RayT
MQNTTPHGRNLRTGRVSEPGRIYLITCVTDQRRPVFFDWRCGRLLVHVLMKEQQHAATLAYVVMPDHLHWLMQLRDDATLGKVMRGVKCISSHRINKRLGRSGRFWQAGYHDRALRTTDDLVALTRYVVANPLRAGLVVRIGDYPLWDAVWL